jgi:murein DD-endopeptidase MepM/ murein hydrolase activator NlpD
MERSKKLEKKVRAIQAKQRQRARAIAKNQRQARAFIKQQQNARRKLDNHIRGLVREAQKRANRISQGGGGSGNGRFTWPAAGVITQTYGCTGFYLEPRRGSCAHFHDGIDIANSPGTPIKSMGAGIVAFVGWNRYDGSDPAYVVVIAHGGNFQTFYSHLQPRKAVRAGQRVRRGQVIGYMGATGKATGVHLHFEVLKDYNPVDPRAYT